MLVFGELLVLRIVPSKPFRFGIGESVGSSKIAWAAFNDMGCTYLVGRFSKGR